MSEEGAPCLTVGNVITFRVACNILSAFCFMYGVDSHNRISANETKCLQYCSANKVLPLILNLS